MYEYIENYLHTEKILFCFQVTDRINDDVEVKYLTFISALFKKCVYIIRVLTLNTHIEYL